MKRFTLPVITLLITALLVTLLWFPAAGAGASAAGHKPKPTPTPSPDFIIEANYQPGAFTGFLAQGAIPGSPCQGTVNLTFSGMPSGVTSLTTTTVTVTQKGTPALFPFKLQASPTATLGNAYS